MADTRKSPTVTEVPLSEIDTSILAALTQQLSTKHRLDGAFVPWRYPVLMVRLPEQEAKKSSKEPIFWDFTPYAKTSVFGCGIHFDIQFTQSGACSQLCIPANHPAFESLQSGKFYFVLYNGNKPTDAVFVDNADLEGRPWEHVWDTVAKHRPLVIDLDAHFWEKLNDGNRLSRLLTASDWLSIGWATAYAGRVMDLKVQLSELQERHPIPDSLDDVQPEALRNALRSIKEHDYDLLRIFESLRPALVADGNRMGFLYHKAFDLDDIPHLAAYEMLIRSFVETLAWSSSYSDCGKRFPWMDSLSTLAEVRTLEILPREFPEWFSPEKYWTHALWDLSYDLGRTISGSDVPVDAMDMVLAKDRFPRADNEAEVTDLGFNFLDDAIEHKKWTIPAKAVVEQQIGIFSQVEFHEHGENVFCVLRTDNGQFHATAVSPRLHKSTFVFPLLTDDGLEEKQAIETGVNLLLYAIIRDFWVVEERERVFRVERRSARQTRRGNGEPKPRIVYLPRVKYTSPLNPRQATQSLGYPERRAHSVAPHLRRVGSASGSQLILAKRYGFSTVPDGYTFVRPHVRGKGQNEVIYKSRSALQSLYTSAVETTDAPSTVLWFQFERDVYDLMAKLGFIVEHVAAGRHGDHGIDVFATKGSDLDRINFVIQCKCWKPSRKIYPATVRELQAVLGEQPRGTRGMIVTTSGFSSGARELADSSDIRLMDGDEFSRLITDLRITTD